MAKFICRLSGGHGEDLASGAVAPVDVSLCCLVNADAPDQIEVPLRDLLSRLRSQGDVIGDVRALYLDDILAITDEPGDAVLWYVSTRPGREPGSSVQLHLPLPIDDSGRIESYGHGTDPVETEGEDVDCEPFIRFEPERKQGKRPRKRNR